MRQKGFALIFILIGALIAVTIIEATYKYYQNNKVKNQNISQSSQFNSPNPSAASEEKPAETNLEPLKTETKKQFNPSGTLAFYFVSDKPAFSPSEDNYSTFQDDPFEICFNGDTDYFTPNYPGEVPHNRSIISPLVLNLRTGRESTLLTVGGNRAPNGCVKITRWTDDAHLMKKSCGSGQIGTCDYHLIDVRDDSIEFLGSSGMFGAMFRMETTKQAQYSENGNITENRAGEFLFSQYCKTEGSNPCGSIEVRKGVPEYALFPYSTNKLLTTLKTIKRMQEVDFEEPENLASLGRQVKIHVGDNNFVFDLQQEKIINSQVPN